MAEISDAIAMIKKAESDAEQLIVDSESQSKDLIAESRLKAEEIISEAKIAAEEEAITKQPSNRVIRQTARERILFTDLHFLISTSISYK